MESLLVPKLLKDCCLVGSSCITSNISNFSVKRAFLVQALKLQLRILPFRMIFLHLITFPMVDFHAAVDRKASKMIHLIFSAFCVRRIFSHSAASVHTYPAGNPKKVKLPTLYDVSCIFRFEQLQ